MKQIITLLCINPESCAAPDVHNAVNAQLPDTERALRRNPVNFDSEGYHLAPNGKVSNLPYELWLAARTPAFREWFGEWERRAIIENLIKRPVPDISDFEITPSNTKEVYRSIGTAKNKETNINVDFVNSAYGKIIRHKEYNPRLIWAMKELFESAVLMNVEMPDFDTPRADGTVHKRRNSIKSFSHFINTLQMDEQTYLIRYTVQNLKSRRGEGAHQLHSQQITKIKISNLANVSTLSVWAETTVASDLKLTSFLKSVNDDVSQAADENGEPEVVHHFSLLDNSHSRVNMEDIHADAFLNLRHPVRNNTAADGGLSSMRDIFADRKYDGAITTDGRTGEKKYLVLHPDQIMKTDSLVPDDI